MEWKGKSNSIHRCESSINGSILAHFFKEREMIPSFKNHLHALFLPIKKCDWESQKPKQKYKIEHTPRLSSHPFLANPSSHFNCKKFQNRNKERVFNMKKEASGKRMSNYFKPLHWIASFIPISLEKIKSFSKNHWYNLVKFVDGRVRGWSPVQHG